MDGDYLTTPVKIKGACQGALPYSDLVYALREIDLTPESTPQIYKDLIRTIESPSRSPGKRSLKLYHPPLSG